MKLFLKPYDLGFSSCFQLGCPLNISIRTSHRHQVWNTWSRPQILSHSMHFSLWTNLTHYSSASKQWRKVYNPVLYPKVQQISNILPVLHATVLEYILCSSSIGFKMLIYCVFFDSAFHPIKTQEPNFSRHCSQKIKHLLGGNAGIEVYEVGYWTLKFISVHTATYTSPHPYSFWKDDFYSILN